jgi:uncharacterized glyoxalase superfamily protein PhnB
VTRPHADRAARRFPQAVPEILVSHGEKAAECRMFLTNAWFRTVHGPHAPVVVWLNLDSKQQVDELFQRWTDRGATIVEPVDDKPWKLREFRIADPDGNQRRVFYDFS